eukprot:scaffold4228_cov135-Isochrysis_galbana.AAC.3
MTGYLRRRRRGWVLMGPASAEQAAEYRIIEFGRVHRGQGSVSRMDWQTYEVSKRGRLWLPTIKGTIEGSDRTLTLHRGVAHLELRRRTRREDPDVVQVGHADVPCEPFKYCIHNAAHVGGTGLKTERQIVVLELASVSVERSEKPDAKSSTHRKRESREPCPEESRSIASAVSGSGLSSRCNFEFKSL